MPYNSKVTEYSNPQGWGVGGLPPPCSHMMHSFWFNFLFQIQRGSRMLVSPANLKRTFKTHIQDASVTCYFVTRSDGSHHGFVVYYF
jgi:hypothetical protein